MHHLWEGRAPIYSLAHVSARRELFPKEAARSRPCGKMQRQMRILLFLEKEASY